MSRIPEKMDGKCNSIGIEKQLIIKQMYELSPQQLTVPKGHLQHAKTPVLTTRLSPGFKIKKPGNPGLW